MVPRRRLRSGNTDLDDIASVNHTRAMQHAHEAPASPGGDGIWRVSSYVFRRRPNDGAHSAAVELLQRTEAWHRLVGVLLTPFLLPTLRLLYLRREAVLATLLLQRYLMDIGEGYNPRS